MACVSSSAILGLQPAFKRAVFCPTSLKLKPMRSKYDNISGKVMRRFDHFCPWMGNVVGENNYVFFLIFCLVQPVVALGFYFASRYAYVEYWSTCSGILGCIGSVVWTDGWLNFCVMSLLFSGLFGVAMTYAILSQSAHNLSTNEAAGIHKYSHFWRLELDEAGMGLASSGSTNARGDTAGRGHGHSHGGVPCDGHESASGGGRGAPSSAVSAAAAEEGRGGLPDSNGGEIGTTRLSFVRRFDNPFSLGSSALNVLASLGLYPQRRVTFADVSSKRSREHKALARRIATILARSALHSFEVTSAGAGDGGLHRAVKAARQLEPPPSMVDTMMGPATRKVNEAAKQLLELPAVSLPGFAARRRGGGLKVFLDLAEGFGSEEGQGSSSSSEGQASAVASGARTGETDGASSESAVAAVLGSRPGVGRRGGGGAGGGVGGVGAASVAAIKQRETGVGDTAGSGVVEMKMKSQAEADIASGRSEMVGIAMRRGGGMHRE